MHSGPDRAARARAGTVNVAATALVPVSTTVTVPLEAPLRHSNGAHWGRFVRTIVEVETDDGLVGLGEMGGGGGGHLVVAVPVAPLAQ